MNHLALLSCLTALAGAALAAPPDPTDPGPEIVAAVQSNFLLLERPLSFNCRVIDDPERRLKTGIPIWDQWMIVTLRGEAAEFARQYTTNELIYALWPYLEIEKDYRDAEVFMVLAGGLDVKFLPSGDPPLPTFKSARRPGNWRAHAPKHVRRLKSSLAYMLGKPYNWHGPGPRYLFDSEAICNDVSNREANIQMMIPYLYDENLRKKDPAQIGSIIGILGFLRATNALPDMMALLFMDFETGGNMLDTLQNVKGEDWLRQIRYRSRVVTQLPFFGVTAWPYLWDKLASVAQTDPVNEAHVEYVISAIVGVFDISATKNATALASMQSYRARVNDNNPAVHAAFDRMAERLRARDDSELERYIYYNYVPPAAVCITNATPAEPPPPPAAAQDAPRTPSSP